jgi:hypothetical protein
MPPSDDLLGTPSLLALAVLAILTFATIARWVRAPGSLVVAAVAASVAFAWHNAIIGREMYGDYWGTFPGYALTTGELRILYLTHALVFVGGSGIFLAAISRRAPWWCVPLLWPVGWFVVVMTVFEVSQALSHLFHWPWVLVQHRDATEFWGGRLAMAYAFIGLIGFIVRKRKATAETERRSMWQRLRFAPLVVGLLVIMGATLELSAQRADQEKAEEDSAQLDYAKRLRADGDRLANEGRWNDALARYDQAEPYDRKGDLALETEQKRREMRAHVGAVVFRPARPRPARRLKR